MSRWLLPARTLASFAVVLGVVCAPGAQARQTAAASEPATASVPAVDTIFADASAKETAVRKALADPDRQPTVLKAVRVVVADYESVVRHYPKSGYCDDALWHAARLSRDAFDLFHDAHERTAALRLLQQLASQYPTSKFARLAPEQISWLNAHAASASPLAVPSAPVAAPPRSAVNAPPAAAAGPPAARPAAPSAAAAVAPAPSANSTATRIATIKAVRRAVLADVVRVVIEADAEIPFHDERIENPTRVFVDLPSTRTAAGLADQTLRFDGDVDIVRQIRIGRQPNSTTRVVLDASGVSSYSVYPLYNPFRLIIDCLRTAPPVPQRNSNTVILSAPLAAGSIPPHLPVARIPVAPSPLLASRSSHVPLALPSGAAVLLGPAVVDAAPVIAATAGNGTHVNPNLPSWARLPATTTAETADAAKPLPATPTAGATVAAPPKPDPGGLSMARQLGLGVSRIVIDPGHGGHDPGAQAGGVNEADLVLDVALRLEKLLAKVQGVEVVLTRRENEFVPLQERTAIANRENADLFLSIHANANSVPSASGIETYFLNFATTQSAAAVAARENATSDQTMGALQDVVKAIALNSKLDESRDFATHVQHEMLDSLRPANKTVKDLGVKQAPFVVLIGAAMPSVLAEISFVTNPQDARLLKTPAFRQRIAQALFDGIRKYQLSLKHAASVAQQN